MKMNTHDFSQVRDLPTDVMEELLVIILDDMDDEHLLTVLNDAVRLLLYCLREAECKIEANEGLQDTLFNLKRENEQLDSMLISCRDLKEKTATISRATVSGNRVAHFLELNPSTESWWQLLGVDLLDKIDFELIVAPINKIAAIKLLRQHLDCGLRGAKEAIEARMNFLAHRDHQQEK
jgi:ribosomal protein L7/L12